MNLKLRNGFVTALVPVILIIAGIAGWVFFSNTSKNTASIPSYSPTPIPGISQVSSTEAIKKSINNAKSLEEVRTSVQTFLTDYNLKLRFTNIPPDPYTTFSNLEEVDLAQTKKFALLFIDEWKKYPIDWVDNSNLEIIAFVKTLYVDGNYRAAVPITNPKGVYYDSNLLSSYINSPENLYYSNEVIHHEYYHLIEYSYFGDFYNSDNIWSSFNNPDFKYISAGKDAYASSDYQHQAHPSEGFVSTYSRYALEEDKAEIYAYIMVTEDYRNILEWVESDPILLKKVNYMKNFMQSHSSSMDDNFFRRVNNIN